MQYHQITSEERYAIAALRRQGYSSRAIARDLGRVPSTISREVARNRRADGGYRAFTACECTSARRTRSRRNERITCETWDLVERYLRLDWSPEQVAGLPAGLGDPPDQIRDHLPARVGRQARRRRALDPPAAGLPASATSRSGRRRWRSARSSATGRSTR
jgi:hypothetical protein